MNILSCFGFQIAPEYDGRLDAKWQADRASKDSHSVQRHIDTIFPFDTIEHYAFFTACDNNTVVGTAGGLGTVCLNTAQGMHHK